MTTSASLADFLEHTRVSVDAALDRALPSPPACPPVVSEAMRYSLFAGGKRLRPVLVLGAADAMARANALDLDRTLSLAMPAACAIEMIHTYSLIHDDLPAMDNDSLRRGRPTLHTIYDDGLAILAGDGLHAEAFAVLMREPESDDPVVCGRKLRVARLIADAAGATGMVGGQAIDLQAAGQVPGHTVTLDANSLRGMHERKTGALIRASAVAGAVMAGATPEQIEAVTRYAEAIGLAFQIVDDILDIEGSAEELGKTAGKDAAGDKPTYPALFGLDASKRLAADCVDTAHGALAAAGLGDTWLGPIADWVVHRKN